MASGKTVSLLLPLTNYGIHRRYITLPPVSATAPIPVYHNPNLALTEQGMSFFVSLLPINMLIVGRAITGIVARYPCRSVLFEPLPTAWEQQRENYDYVELKSACKVLTLL